VEHIIELLQKKQEANGDPSDVHYPTEDLVQDDQKKYFLSGNGISPGKLILKNGIECIGMKVKKNTFAVSHTIGRMKLTTAQQNEFPGKGQSTRPRLNQGRQRGGGQPGYNATYTNRKQDKKGPY